MTLARWICFFQASMAAAQEILTWLASKRMWENYRSTIARPFEYGKHLVYERNQKRPKACSRNRVQIEEIYYERESRRG
jgi:hypothetical protein